MEKSFIRQQQQISFVKSY
ncbi:hypothetical protein Q4S09_11220, partial [Morganella morganii]